MLGAGGGVGLATIDVAVALGGVAIGAASTDAKRAAAIAAGARAVIDTTTEDVKDRARALAADRRIRRRAPDRPASTWSSTRSAATWPSRRCAPWATAAATS